MAIDFSKLTDVELDLIAEELAGTVERMQNVTDSEAIRCMIDNGCPARDAAEQVKHPQLGVFARQFYVDCQDARLGNAEARAKVEAVREGWAKMNKALAAARRPAPPV
jgi:hypothetical protein